MSSSPMRNPLSHRPRSSGCIVRILMLALLYVLSHGPVQALYSSGRLEGPFPAALAMFYQPVSWLRDHTPLGSPMRSYAGWWQGVLKRS